MVEEPNNAAKGKTAVKVNKVAEEKADNEMANRFADGMTNRSWHTLM